MTGTGWFTSNSPKYSWITLIRMKQYEQNKNYTTCDAESNHCFLPDTFKRIGDLLGLHFEYPLLVSVFHHPAAKSSIYWVTGFRHLHLGYSQCHLTQSTESRFCIPILRMTLHVISFYSLHSSKSYLRIFRDYYEWIIQY